LNVLLQRIIVLLYKEITGVLTPVNAVRCLYAQRLTFFHRAWRYIMKKMITIAALSVILSPVYADDYGHENNQNGSNNNYESTTGTRYQYDMSDPSDRVDYGVDIDAQMRDQLSVDPSRNLDQGLGEYGGGIYDD